MQNPEHFRAENKHMHRYMSTCTGTHVGKRGSGVHVEHVPVHVVAAAPV